MALGVARYPGLDRAGCFGMLKVICDSSVYTWAGNPIDTCIHIYIYIYIYICYLLHTSACVLELPIARQPVFLTTGSLDHRNINLIVCEFRRPLHV